MPRFTLNKLFAPWTSAQQPPSANGWYRTRTEPLTHSWWNAMAYFDGGRWWVSGTVTGSNFAVRREIRVLQWQGLDRPAGEALALVRANMPASRDARKRFERFAAVLSA